MNLALNAEILNEKTRDILLAKAYAQMLSVASEVAAKDENAVDDEIKEKLSSTAAKVETKDDNNEEPEDEEEAEEEEGDAAAGLGALFG
jgi:large subunit ribosomal protein L10